MDTPVIREAIIVPDGGDPMRPVAGVPLLVRTLVAFQRAGIERCMLIAPIAPPSDRRIRCALAVSAALAPLADDALRLVMGASTVIDAALVRDLQARARPGQVLVVADGEARVRVTPGPLVAATGGLPTRPTVGTLRLASTPGPQLQQALLRALENPRDGYLDRLLHRRLSRPLTRRLLRTPLSPNAITLAGIALGVAGGCLLAAPGAGALLAAVLCLIASGVLDCSDGELARLRLAESRLGHALDVGGDTVVHMAVLGGLAVRVARVSGWPGWPVLAALALGILGAFTVITWSESTERRRRRVVAWENRVLDGVLGPLSTRDWHVFPLAFALAGRLDLLLPAAAVGAHAFWLVALVLLVRVLRRTTAGAILDAQGAAVYSPPPIELTGRGDG
jgi:phosphatidylglycerophosphate synthase